jgi:hypothetical protein
MIVDPKFYVMAEMIVRDINGRAADSGRSLPALGKVVHMAGPGDHVEIGTLFGASAIMAALVKEEFGMTGQIYCIDPLTARDPNIQYHEDNERIKNNKEATLEIVLENFDKFKVSDRIVMLPQPSVPWPEDLKDHQFVSGFIDGDHFHGMPWQDFLNTRDRVKNFLMIDNFEEAYPEVVIMGVRALSVGGWFLHYKEGVFLSLRRPFVINDNKDLLKLRDASMI